MALARFMATPFGRGLRIVLGLALVTFGVVLALAKAPVLAPIALIAVGAVLAVVGTANVCPLAVLVGGPFDGRKVRSGEARTR
ncbi:DUF2892 domain-containing protein [Pseudoclavibacter chungangensis]|uniref:DUF2892 domain-containing protein n=1 Tax=Pseudoclavibacter chungangensis TaxID=587635 RepID=A0A7J5BNY6_9MICO|nr:YgaP-like transmembrane domain [Pseudoclavibacter chungangensis]KAB1654271.1 DUF2892 domain-containing protein [Pseudoclavibacter chungangensis]NYJ65325.1 hypothetical protein [Pseudoclavibacter chungangensis]